MCHATGACPAGKSAWWSLLQSPVGGWAGVARKHRRGVCAGVEAVNETEALQAPGLSASAQASSTGSRPCSGLAHKTWMSGWAPPDEGSGGFPGRAVEAAFSNALRGRRACISALEGHEAPRSVSGSCLPLPFSLTSHDKPVGVDPDFDPFSDKAQSTRYRWGSEQIRRGGVTTGGQLVRVKRGSISESTGLFFRIGLPDGPGFAMHVLSTLGPTEAVGKKVRAGCRDLPFNRPFLMRGRGCAGNRCQNVVTGPFQEAAVEFLTLAEQALPDDRLGMVVHPVRAHSIEQLEGWIRASLRISNGAFR